MRDARACKRTPVHDIAGLYGRSLQPESEWIRLWDMLRVSVPMQWAEPVVRHALLSCTWFAWRCRVQQYAGLLLESLRGAALGLLQGSFAGDHAPWLEGPHKASIAGSLCLIMVRLGLHGKFNVVSASDIVKQDFLQETSASQCWLQMCWRHVLRVGPSLCSHRDAAGWEVVPYCMVLVIARPAFCADEHFHQVDNVDTICMHTACMMQVGLSKALRDAAQRALLEAVQETTLSGALGRLLAEPGLAEAMLGAFSGACAAAQAVNAPEVTSGTP